MAHDDLLNCLQLARFWKCGEFPEAVSKPLSGVTFSPGFRPTKPPEDFEAEFSKIFDLTDVHQQKGTPLKCPGFFVTPGREQILCVHKHGTNYRDVVFRGSSR